ncbi:thermonuclease family protein [Microbacterium trichothecenolyticum]|uniref:PASTA domain-containing protein n=1 Tax=Microbacterium trichothecenolyticum TaxID=69370 RepID=A0A0M2HEF5_MICTR|nr:hypothetical protein [Microbacterium trichothecenolyticum]KJL45015.1 hypothetical protein RS82_00525 [Microbacterium trichothecenolyticum]
MLATLLVGCEGRPAEIVPDVAGLTASEALSALAAQDIDAPDYEWALVPPYDTLPLLGTEPAAGSSVRAPWRIDRLVFTPITVTAVVDGATLDISTGDRLRLIGIAPRPPGECGSAEATAELAKWVTGQEIYVENPPEVEDRDDAGSLLVYVSLQGVNDVGYQMVRTGMMTPSNSGHPASDIYANGFSEALPYSCAPPPAPESPAPVLPAMKDWQCTYDPTMNENWYDDVVCRNGSQVVRPILREWDDFIEEWEMREEADAYERFLNDS